MEDRDWEVTASHPVHAPFQVALANAMADPHLSFQGKWPSKELLLRQGDYYDLCARLPSQCWAYEFIAPKPPAPGLAAGVQWTRCCRTAASFQRSVLRQRTTVSHRVWHQRTSDLNMVGLVYTAMFSLGLVWVYRFWMSLGSWGL